MLEKYSDSFCRICMNESHSYSPIYEEIYPDNSMLFEVINDVCQLEITMGDELPRYICSDCSFKLSEFRKFKMRSHEVQASLQRFKENILNLYLDIQSESSLTGNREYIKVDVDTQDSYDYASGRVESFEEYIGIEPDDFNLSTVDMENSDIKTALPDPLDLNLSTVDMEKYDVKTAAPDPLEEGYLPTCTTNGNASQLTNQASEEIVMNVSETVKGKKLLGMKLLAGNIEGRKTIDEPEDKTICDARRPIPCSNNDTVNFEGIGNPSLENGSEGEFEYDDFGENSTSETVLDKSENHQCGGENPSNLSNLDINEDDDNIRKTFRIPVMPITSRSITPNSGDLRKEKIFSKGGDLDEGNEISKSRDFEIRKREEISKSEVNVNNRNKKDRIKRFCCDTCDKRYYRKIHLRDHMTTHTGEKNFQCLICKKCFARKREVTGHSLIHENSRVICTVCGKEMKHNSLRQHMLIHDDVRNFSCDVCGKGFIHKSNLYVHLRTHTGEQPFLCSICGKRFKNYGAFQQHAMVHSKIKPFSCEICGMKFSLKRGKTSHMMRHSDERPFSCDQCDKTFKLKMDLRRHLKVHEGLKPYKCSMCDKAFQIKNNLKAHVRCHTGEKPYPCPNCGKCFSQSSSVNVHLKGRCGGKMSKK